MLNCSWLHCSISYWWTMDFFRYMLCVTMLKMGIFFKRVQWFSSSLLSFHINLQLYKGPVRIMYWFSFLYRNKNISSEKRVESMGYGKGPGPMWSLSRWQFILVGIGNWDCSCKALYSYTSMKLLTINLLSSSVLHFCVFISAFHFREILYIIEIAHFDLGPVIWL